MATIQGWMEWAAFALDSIAVAIIVGGAVVAAVRCNLLGIIFRLEDTGRIERYKKQLVSGLLLGLDLLVASDVIKTTALEMTLANVGALGLLVVVRIALTWSLIVESDSRWPWQPAAAPAGGGDETR